MKGALELTNFNFPRFFSPPKNLTFLLCLTKWTNLTKASHLLSGNMSSFQRLESIFAKNACMELYEKCHAMSSLPGEKLFSYASEVLCIFFQDKLLSSQVPKKGNIVVYKLNLSLIRPFSFGLTAR